MYVYICYCVFVLSTGLIIRCMIPYNNNYYYLFLL